MTSPITGIPIAGSDFGNVTPKEQQKQPFEILTNAVEKGDLENVKSALKNGADSNGIIGVSNIIHRACEKGNLDIVRELLDNGAYLHIRSWKWSDTPLHRACVFGHASIVKELIERQASVNVRNSNCWMTPLEDAITFGHLECCKLLIKAGARVNEVNHNYGSTPLTEACSKGNYDIVKLLIDSEANPDLSKSITPLNRAVAFPKILQLMVDRGANVNCKNASGCPTDGNHPLHEAATLGYDKSVQILLKAGANPKATNDRNQTPLDKAKWQLNSQKTEPCNPPETTAKIIQRLEKVIELLESSM